MKRRSPAALALALARDLDRDLDRARARDLDQDLDRDLARALDRADALALTLADDRTLADAPALADALTIALARARNLSSARTRARNLLRVLARARNRARALDHNLHVAVWAAGGAGSIPSRMPRALLALVVRMLPEHDRQRAREELRSELVELPRREQLGHALRVLAHAWALRCALTEPVRTPDGAPVRPAKR